MSKLNALLEKGDNLMERCLFREARDCYEKVWGKYKSDRVIPYNIGYCFFNDGNFSQARDFFDEALKIDPNYTDALFNKANSLFSLNDYEQAEISYQKAIELKPDYDLAYFGLARMKYQQGEKEKSLSYFEKLIELNQKNENALVWKGIILNDLRRFEEAITLFNEVLILNENNFDAHFQTGLAQMEMKNYQSSQVSFKNARSIDTKHIDSYLREGLCNYHFKCFQEALDLWLICANLKMNDDEILAKIALCYEKIGNNTKADEYYEKSLQVNGENLLALKYKIRIAFKNEYQGNIDSQLNTIIQKDPENNLIFFYKARFFLSTKSANLHYIKDDLDKGLNFDFKNRNHFFGIGLILSNNQIFLVSKCIEVIKRSIQIEDQLSEKPNLNVKARKIKNDLKNVLVSILDNIISEVDESNKIPDIRNALESIEKDYNLLMAPSMESSLQSIINDDDEKNQKENKSQPSENQKPCTFCSIF